MGECTLTSHAKEQSTVSSCLLHSCRLGDTILTRLLPATDQLRPQALSSLCPPICPPKLAPLRHRVRPARSIPYTSNAHLKAETIWALNVVGKNYSFKSCEGVNDLFQAMFLDSIIAKSFQCAERNASYMMAFGIAPYLQRKLRNRVKGEEGDYVIVFDESVNDSLQAKRMDVLV